jgi:predicted phage baseplate assembly protein
MLREELLAQGFTDRDLRTESDPRTNKLTEVWVLWRERPHFYFSGPDDRHYVVERIRGRVLFGDGRSGKLPPAGSGNIRAREYRAGGGLVGNVPAGEIRQIMSGVLASAVTNPRAGEGGADGETPEMLRVRGPHVLRHRGRSLSALDYEALAREASPAVAAVRVLPATAPNGLPAPGWVTIIVVPQSQDPQPQPSFELRKQVHDFIALRAPATLDPDRIGVIGPVYLPVGLGAVAIPRDPSLAGSVKDAAVAAMARFLHPLTGGPDGTGWPFGRGVYASDAAAILEGIAGMDHVELLELQLDGTPVGNYVAVPPDRMVVAGPLRIEVRGS